MQNKEILRVIRLYYGFQFFFSLLIWLPVFYAYQKRIGLGDEQIFSIQSIYYLAFCFLEIPTGYLADRWGYRLCMRAGAVVVALANLLPIFAQSYEGFLLHFLMIAVARSFISGASSAYLYDYLHAHGAAAEYKIVEGKARAYGLVGKVFFWSCVGYLMEWQLTAPYWLTFAATSVSVVFAWRLPRLDSHTTATNHSLALSGLGAALIRSPILIFLMLQGVAIFVLGRICQVNLFQPILESKSFDLGSFGWVMALITIFEAVGSGFPGIFRTLTDDLNAVFLLTAVMALTLALIPYGGQIVTVASLCVFSLAMGFSFPIQRQLLNDAIPDSKRRATILSVESIMDRAVNAGVASLLGASLAQGQLNQFLLSSAAITLLGMAVLYVALRSLPLRPQTLRS